MVKLSALGGVDVVATTLHRVLACISAAEVWQRWGQTEEGVGESGTAGRQHCSTSTTHRTSESQNQANRGPTFEFLIAFLAERHFFSSSLGGSALYTVGKNSPAAGCLRSSATAEAEATNSAKITNEISVLMLIVKRYVV
jgi:hypothetical protein